MNGSQLQWHSLLLVSLWPLACCGTDSGPTCLVEEEHGSMKEVLRDLVLLTSNQVSEAPQRCWFGTKCLIGLGTPMGRSVVSSHQKQINEKIDSALLCICLLKEPADSPCAQQRVYWGCSAWKSVPALPSGYTTIAQVLQDSPRWKEVGNFYHLFQWSPYPLWNGNG